MDALRRMFEAWGGTNVETFIASGNVIFDSSRRNAEIAERLIEKHVHQALGYPSLTYLRSITELAAIAAHQPFPQEEFDQGAKLWVGFMKQTPGRSAVKEVLALRGEYDDFAVEGRELYWLRRANFMESLGNGPPLERILGAPITTRNVNTVRRLAAKYCD